MLYKCADLTLSNNVSISASVTCTNATNSTGTSGGSSGAVMERSSITYIATMLGACGIALIAI
jgi:hypothetical protein